MRKSEVYSWRLDPGLKAALEEAARRERATVSELLDRVVARWLEERREGLREDEAEQGRLRAAVLKTVGSIRGGDPGRSARVRTAVRERLEKRRG